MRVSVRVDRWSDPACARRRTEVVTTIGAFARLPFATLAWPPTIDGTIPTPPPVSDAIAGAPDPVDTWSYDADSNRMRALGQSRDLPTPSTVGAPMAPPPAGTLRAGALQMQDDLRRARAQRADAEAASTPPAPATAATATPASTATTPPLTPPVAAGVVVRGSTTAGVSGGLTRETRDAERVTRADGAEVSTTASSMAASGTIARADATAADGTSAQTTTASGNVRAERAATTINTTRTANGTTTDTTNTRANVEVRAGVTAVERRDAQGVVTGSSTTRTAGVAAEASVRDERVEVQRVAGGTDTRRRVQGASVRAEAERTEQVDRDARGAVQGSTTTTTTRLRARGELSVEDATERRAGATTTRETDRRGVTADVQRDRTTEEKRDAQGQRTATIVRVDDRLAVTARASTARTEASGAAKDGQTATVDGALTRTEKGAVTRDASGRVIAEDTTRAQQLRAKATIGATSENAARETATDRTTLTRTSDTVSASVEVVRDEKETRKQTTAAGPTTLTETIATTLKAEASVRATERTSTTEGPRRSEDERGQGASAKLERKASTQVVTQEQNDGKLVPGSTTVSTQLAGSGRVDVRLGEGRGERPLGVTVEANAGTAATTKAPGVAAPELDAPRDAAALRALPEGTTITRKETRGVRVAGGLGADTAGADRARGTAAVGVELSATVKRGKGDAVTLEFASQRALEAGATAEQTVGAKGKDPASVVATGEATTKRVEVARAKLTLDLAKPEDRAIYDAYASGDLAPAQARAKAQGTFDARVERAGALRVGASVSTAFGENVRGERAQVRLSSTDAAVAKDSDRQALAAERRAAGAPEPQWVEDTGALRVGASREASAQAGPLSVSGGFTAGQSVRFRVVRPDDGPAPTGPVSAAEAANLPRGTELVLRGESNLGGKGKAAVGAQQAVPGVGTVRASAGVSAQAEVAHEVEIAVKKKEGAIVEVGLKVGDRRAAQVGVEVGAGFTPSPAIQGASQATALAAGVTGRDGPARASNALGQLDVGFEAKRGAARAEASDVRYRLDLATDEGRRAYEGLVRGDPTVAQAEAERAQAALARGEAPGGVRFVQGKETVRAEQTSAVGFNVGTRTQRSETRRVSEETRTTTERERVTTQSELGERDTTGFLGRRRKVTSVAEASSTGAEGFTFRYERRDRYTSKDEVTELLRLGGVIGAQETEARIERRKGGPSVAGVFGAKDDHGPTATEVAVNVSREGLERARSAPLDEKAAAAGRARAKLEDREPPAWARSDATGAEARAALDAIQAAPDARRGALESQYASRFGERAGDAMRTRRDATETAKTLDRALASPDAAKRADALVDEMQRRGFGYEGLLGTLVELAGTRAVEVRSLRMEGPNVRIRSKDVDAP